MNEKVKKLFSVLFLFLFLFPMLEKGAHALKHVADFHCSSTDKHFHSVEHNCSICDYTSTSSNASPEKPYQFILSVSTFSFIPYVESIEIQNAFNNLPARAPPVV